MPLIIHFRLNDNFELHLCQFFAPVYSGRSSNRIRFLARAAQLSEGLFLCPYRRFLKGFIPGPTLLSARIKRSKYINLSLVFEKVIEPFRMNNQKTQCEQCLRVDNSRSGYSEFSLIGCGITEARRFIYTAKGKQRITSLLSYLRIENKSIGKSDSQRYQKFCSRDIKPFLCP